MFTSCRIPFSFKCFRGSLFNLHSSSLFYSKSTYMLTLYTKLCFFFASCSNFFFREFCTENWENIQPCVMNFMHCYMNSLWCVYNFGLDFFGCLLGLENLDGWIFWLKFGVWWVGRSSSWKVICVQDKVIHFPHVLSSILIKKFKFWAFSCSYSLYYLNILKWWLQNLIKLAHNQPSAFCETSSIYSSKGSYLKLTSNLTSTTSSSFHLKNLKTHWKFHARRQNAEQNLIKLLKIPSLLLLEQSSHVSLH